MQRRLDQGELDKLLAAYNDGALINELASTFGVSQSAVINNLKRLGAESRRGVIERRIEEARALYEQGWSLAQVGAVWGVHAATVRSSLIKSGVTLRPRPGSG